MRDCLVTFPLHRATAHRTTAQSARATTPIAALVPIAATASATQFASTLKASAQPFFTLSSSSWRSDLWYVRNYPFPLFVVEIAERTCSDTCSRWLFSYRRVSSSSSSSSLLLLSSSSSSSSVVVGVLQFPVVGFTTTSLAPLGRFASLALPDALSAPCSRGDAPETWLSSLAMGSRCVFLAWTICGRENGPFSEKL